MYHDHWRRGCSWGERVYPPVNPAVFIESAKHFQVLYADAYKVTEKISSSSAFAEALMNHAQANEKEKAIGMVKRTGISSDVDIRYTPDTLSVILHASNECCQLIIRLRWQ